MVEEQPRAHGFDDMGDDGVKVPEDVARSYPQGHNVVRCELAVTPFVELRLIAPLMALPIDLDRQLRLCAKEIEDVKARRMLLAELVTSRPLLERAPQDDLGKRHCTS